MTSSIVQDLLNEQRRRFPEIDSTRMENSNNNNNLNNGNNSRIKWENKRVNNLPNANIVTLNNFKNGDKAVQYKVGHVNQYMSLNSFRGFLKKNSRLNPAQAYNSDPSKFMFVNPLNPSNRVKREDIKFVTLHKIKPTTEKLKKKKEKLRKKIVEMEARLKNARKNKT